MTVPKRILLDTNIFILGYRIPDSVSGQLLANLRQSEATIILSNELTEQIRRVSRRVGGKDWAGFVIDQIWRDFQIAFVWISEEEKQNITKSTQIPREDIGIYLSALKGQTDCMVSANHGFVREAAAQQNLFQCFKPDEFLKRFFKST